MERQTLLGFLFAVALAAIISIAALWMVYQYQAAADARQAGYAVRDNISDIETLIRDAETGQRGYLLTGDESYLQPYRAAQLSMNSQVGEVLRTSRIPGVREKCNQLSLLLQRKMDELQQTVELRKGNRDDEALGIVKTGQGQHLMEQIKAVIQAMRQEEDSAMQEREARVQHYAKLCRLIIVLILVAGIGSGILSTQFMIRQLRERQKTRLALAGANNELQAQVAALDQRNLEISLLSEMASQLHACHTLDEAYAAITQYVPKLLPTKGGSLYVYTASRDCLDQVSQWGTSVDQETFSPEKCWALRQGRAYRVDDRHHGLRCEHSPGDEPYVCVPMLAQGDPIGMLHLDFPDSDSGQSRNGVLQLATTAADQIALSLVNLKLRDTLRAQSIRDPLTGLFNRRYLEESLERESRRAIRREQPLAAVMVDLDHFKKLNDTYGHEAGDAALAAVSNIILESTRTEDIACRYGGEELLLIMPEASVEHACARAESIRQAISALRLRHNSATLQITASMGVAAMPNHGSTVEDLLRAADRALYKAKQQGRNRVEQA